MARLGLVLVDGLDVLILWSPRRSSPEDSNIPTVPKSPGPPIWILLNDFDDPRPFLRLRHPRAR